MRKFKKILTVATITMLMVGCTGSNGSAVVPVPINKDVSEGGYDAYAQAVVSAPINKYVTASGHDAYAEIDENDIYRMIDIVCLWGIDFTNYLSEYNKTPIVALVRIDSINGGRVYTYDKYDSYGYPHTYGMMTILDVYKGKEFLEIGNHYSYLRHGGIVTREELKSNPSHNNIEGTSEYIELMFIDDVRIEVGKMYVVFIGVNPDVIYSTEGELIIGGFEMGLKEAKYSEEGLEVLNNLTMVWEDIFKLIPFENREK